MGYRYYAARLNEHRAQLADALEQLAREQDAHKRRALLGAISHERSMVELYVSLTRNALPMRFHAVSAPRMGG